MDVNEKRGFPEEKRYQMLLNNVKVLNKWLLNMTIKFNDRKSGPILQSIKNESQILIAEEWMKSDRKRDYKYRPLLLRDRRRGMTATPQVKVNFVDIVLLFQVWRSLRWH